MKKKNRMKYILCIVLTVVTLLTQSPMVTLGSELELMSQNTTTSVASNTTTSTKIFLNKTSVKLDLAKNPVVELRVNGLPSGYTVRWKTDDTDTVRLSASVGQKIKVKGLISFTCNVYASVYTKANKLYKTYKCKVEVFGKVSESTSTEAEGTVTKEELKKARMNLDYSVVSARDIIRYYTSIGKEGSKFGETEAECRQVLKKVDKMIDELYSIQGQYIKTPFELGMYLAHLLTWGNISSCSNKDGSYAWYNYDGALDYMVKLTNDEAYTGTGKYFKEGILNGASDCWGKVVCTQLVINRAAELKGFSREELEATYVRQGSDHAINIISIKCTTNNKRYHFAYGINVNTSLVKYWRTSGAESSKDILCELAGGVIYHYKIVDGKIKKIDSLYHITLSKEEQEKTFGMNPEGTRLWYGSGIKDESFKIPDTVVDFSCQNNNKYLKNLTLSKKQKYITILRLSNLTTIDYNGVKSVECSHLNSNSPLVKNQVSENGYFTVPTQMEMSVSSTFLSNTITIDEDTLDITYSGPKWRIESTHTSAIENAKIHGIPYDLY